MTIEPLWFCTSPSGIEKEALTQSLFGALEATGLTLQWIDDLDNASGAGIMLLKEIAERVFHQLAFVSKDGERRVLVLLAGESDPHGEVAWKLLQSGASDVLIWQEGDEIGELVAARFQRWREVDRILNSPLVCDNLVGQSKVWRDTLRQVIEAATYMQEPVLLVGETGTGKELAARLIHTLDQRRKRKNLVIVDCTTINPDLCHSELFGHERGAFTGAVSARDGAFATADGGTLFLDEIGELSPALQVQLLRVLQERSYRRVGSNVWRKTDFRLICATNRNLLEDMKTGLFRSDLYFRIASWTIELPPLRQRGNDILLLVKYFLKQASGGNPIPELDERVKQYFLSRNFEGNVRELMNTVYRIYSRYPGAGRIMPGDIPYDEWPHWQNCADTFLRNSYQAVVKLALEQGVNWPALQGRFKDAVFQAAMECTNDSPKEAADLLGVDVRTVQYWRSDQRKRLSLEN